VPMSGRTSPGSLRQGGERLREETDSRERGWIGVGQELDPRLGHTADREVRIESRPDEDAGIRVTAPPSVRPYSGMYPAVITFTSSVNSRVSGLPFTPSAVAFRLRPSIR